MEKIVKGNKDGDKLTFDEWPEQGSADVFTTLRGFLAKSPMEDHVRLFLNLRMEKYVDIPRGDILHSVKLAPEFSPLGGTEVVLRKGAELEFGFKIKTNEVQSSFLGGPIASNRLSRASAGGGGVNIDVPTWIVCGVSPLASVIIVLSW